MVPPKKKRRFEILRYPLGSVEVWASRIGRVGVRLLGFNSAYPEFVAGPGPVGGVGSASMCLSPLENLENAKICPELSDRFPVKPTRETILHIHFSKWKGVVWGVGSIGGLLAK